MPVLLAGGAAACAPADPRDYWQQYYVETVAAGLQRTEREPEDAPLSSELIIESFRTLAFNFEKDPLGRGEDNAETEMIRKWRKPIRYAVFADPGDSIRIGRPMDIFVERLRAITGHPIQPSTPENGNSGMNLLVLFARDRTLRTVIETAIPKGQAPANDEEAWQSFLSRSIEPWYDSLSPCAGNILVGDGTEDVPEGEVFFALILIRHELPPALLDSCIEEEISQAMGIFNDAFTVRPSVFNDDEEFALLTRHDETLLKILYDPRLGAGMTPDEAMPIVRQLAASLLE